MWPQLTKTIRLYSANIFINALSVAIANQRMLMKLLSRDEAHGS